MPDQFFTQLRVAIDLGVDIDEMLQIDEDLDPRQTDGGVGCRRLDVQPPGDGGRVGHRGEIGRHGLQQLAGLIVAADAECQRTLGRDVLATADFSQSSQHRLEAGEACLDFFILPQNIRDRPGGNHHAGTGRRGLGQAPLGCDSAQQLPDFLGDERDHRVQQPQQYIQRVSQDALSRGALRFVLKAVLQHLDIEAAELVPGEIVQAARGIRVVVTLQGLGHLLSYRRQAAEDPTVLDRQIGVGHRAARVPVQIDQGEPRGVPQFVAEIASHFEPFADRRAPRQCPVGFAARPLGREIASALGARDARQLAILLRLLDQRLAMRALELDGQPDVLVFGGQMGHAEPQGVGAEFVDHIQRIDAVPLALGHGLAIPVQDLRMDEHIPERNLAHVVQSHQHHARHPQRDDVPAGDQHAGRIKEIQLGRLIRPAHRRMRPQGGTEPGVQHVFLLAQTGLLQNAFCVFVARSDADIHRRLFRAWTFGNMDGHVWLSIGL